MHYARLGRTMHDYQDFSALSGDKSDGDGRPEIAW